MGGEENQRPAGMMVFGQSTDKQCMTEHGEQSVMDAGKAKISQDRAAKAKERIAARRKEKGKMETLVA